MAPVSSRTPQVKLGFKLADTALDRELAGRTLDERDYDILLTRGPMLVRMPDGRPLCCYLPGVLRNVMQEVDAYKILHPLHSHMTNNRGLASGSKRIERGAGGGTRSDAMSVSSALLGAIDPGGVYKYCRTTEWTGANLPEWQALAPMFRVIASYFNDYIPERYATQMEYVRKTDPGWVVPGTPFTSITVNNSYPTGVHKDAGDLETGFSTIACIRRGEYEGGVLVFPQYRVAVDLHDGDLLLMDAHQWHGNTRMFCSCGERIQNKFCSYCGAERISIVSYYRTRMSECGSPEEEYERALENTEKRSQPRKKDQEPEATATATPEPKPEPEPEAEHDQEASIATVEPEPAAPEPEPVPASTEKPARRRVVKKAATAAEAEPGAPAETRSTARRKDVQATAEPAKSRTRRKATVTAAVKIRLDPETGEPLEG